MLEFPGSSAEFHVGFALAGSLREPLDGPWPLDDRVARPRVVAAVDFLLPGRKPLCSLARHLERPWCFQQAVMKCCEEFGCGLSAKTVVPGIPGPFRWPESWLVYSAAALQAAPVLVERRVVASEPPPWHSLRLAAVPKHDAVLFLAPAAAS